MTVGGIRVAPTTKRAALAGGSIFRTGRSRGYCTVSVPFIPMGACGSHW